MGVWINQYIQGLSSAEYHFQILVLCILLLFIVYKVFKAYHRFRFIGDTPTSRVASAAQGYVELKGLGEMMPGESISSPFSHRRCLWYQCIVEKRQRIKNNNLWVEESNEISDHLFYLHDDSGVCVVNPDGAFVIPSQKITWYGSHLGARYNRGLKSSWINAVIGFGRYRFTERIIAVADALYVIGQFKTIDKSIDPETLKNQVESLVKHWKTHPSYYLRSFDQDKNGKIQKQEWKKIRRHAEQVIREQNQHTVHHVMKKPGEANQPFVISTRSEQQILNKKRGLLMVYLGLFFFLLYVLLVALK